MIPDNDDFDILASRATDPTFYHAPHGEKEPFQYQHAGVEYALARDHCLIGDAPGLGKSCQSILLSNAIGARHTLVVCPASLRLNWEREVRMWSTIGGVTTYPILKARDGVSLEHNYVIISYDLLRNPQILAAILDRKWDHLVLDEAHYLKDPKGNKRTHAICAPDGLPSVVGRITMASGTILPNQPIECYNAVRLLNWNAIDRASLESFREAYYEEGWGFVRKQVEHVGKDGQRFTTWDLARGRVRNVPTNLADLNYRLRKNVMVRRLKDQVLHELPPKQWHPFPLATTPEMKRVMKHPGWVEAEALYRMDPDAFQKGIPVDGAISTARRELGEAKALAVCEYVEELFEEGVGKLILAGWHHSVLDIYREHFNKRGRRFVYMDGSTSQANKQRAVDLFQNDDSLGLIIGQMLPLGEGWTLTAAQDLVNSEPYWVPGKNDQLLDRIHRIGQKGGHVIGHIPVVPGTLDEDILGTAIEKDMHIFDALDRRY